MVGRGAPARCAGGALTPMPLPLAVGLCALAAAITLAVADGRARRVFVWTKPATTALLLLVVGVAPAGLFDGGAAGRYAGFVAAGIVLSLAGDIVLLADGNRAFLGGLGFFLFAHVAYMGAFLAGGAPPPAPATLAVVFVMALATTALLIALRPGVPAALRLPVALYAAVIGAMAAAALLAAAGAGRGRPYALAAAVGAVLFYTSDAILAWNRFRRSLPRAQALNLAFYFSGQIGIALSARLFA